MVSEPLSDTLLRMSREQLALLEITYPQKSPWLVSEFMSHDVVISLIYSIRLFTASFLFR